MCVCVCGGGGVWYGSVGAECLCVEGSCMGGVGEECHCVCVEGGGGHVWGVQGRSVSVCRSGWRWWSCMGV